ncbi:MAG: hypothetical protein MK135_11510 [Polyangiaceae bacterium]|nr:hypothetical protein [Polyangiaceae bacterium]
MNGEPMSRPLTIIGLSCLLAASAAAACGSTSKNKETAIEIDTAPPATDNSSSDLQLGDLGSTPGSGNSGGLNVQVAAVYDGFKLEDASGSPTYRAAEVSEEDFQLFASTLDNLPSSEGRISWYYNTPQAMFPGN